MFCFRPGTQEKSCVKDSETALIFFVGLPFGVTCVSSLNLAAPLWRRFFFVECAADLPAPDYVTYGIRDSSCGSVVQCAHWPLA
jgi:hypothetical protein